ncbi:hypothetical protein BDW22DRAFT_91124 [Trametopsis cervina]|nr:hypothetical protein BDW22DRAFT_91124 [Trametopsis cervina]
MKTFGNPALKLSVARLQAGLLSPSPPARRRLSWSALYWHRSLTGSMHASTCATGSVSVFPQKVSFRDDRPNRTPLVGCLSASRAHRSWSARLWHPGVARGLWTRQALPFKKCKLSRNFVLYEVLECFHLRIAHELLVACPSPFAGSEPGQFAIGIRPRKRALLSSKYDLFATDIPSSFWSPASL